jgi:outer membrane protein OmpA-like peptidoglycan-associated protein
VFEEEDRETGYAVFIAVTVAIVVSLFAIAVAIGNVIGQAGTKPAAPKAAAPSIVRVLGKVYFEVGKADLPDDAPMLLRPAIRMAKAVEGSKLVVSGYHDASGDPAANAELAKRRALAVRDLLVAAGVGEQRIELAKPVVTMGGADDAEARRVEVTLR